ncbi:MAG: GAF domain-containing protein [Ignavibacteria bacterium]|nr:GAF domain-containing protein [Ignavibacteria bacterium]
MSTEDEQAKDDQASRPKGIKIDLSHTLDSAEEVDLSLEEIKERLAQAQSFYNRVSTLSEIALQIDAARSQEDVMQVLRSEAKWLIDHDVCFISLLNKSRTHYLINTLSPIADATELNHKHFLVNQGMSGWVIQNQSPIFLDVTAGPVFTESIEGTLADLGMKSLLIVPLRTGDETIGCFTMSSARPGAYQEREMWIAQLLAQQVAVALKNVALFDSAKKRITQIELVNEIAEKLTSTLELEELLKAAAETIRKNFNYFDVTIFLVDRGQDVVTLVAHSGKYVDFLPPGYCQKLSEGIVGWVASHGQKVLANDVSEDPRYMAFEYHSTKSELAIPIQIEDEIVGVLNIEDTKLHAFDETDTIVLETLCDQLGSATKNAKLYDQAKKANATLTELDKMKSDFLGIVSHDFRSPLASIILAAKALLKRGDAVDKGRMNEYLTVIVDQANKLSHLAEDTLSITKMESGQLTYFFKVVNVERLIKDAASLVHFSRRHTLEYHVDNSVSYIKGDQTKLRQVVQNLLSNAVKYSPKGGLISVKAENYSHDQLLISVRDGGIGIPSEQQERLFQKFSRIDTEEARDIKGSGLGLWISKEIVKAHGGRIWVESEPGKGSVFSFTLRKAQQEPSAS